MSLATCFASNSQGNRPGKDSGIVHTANQRVFVWHSSSCRPTTACVGSIDPLDSHVVLP